MKFETASILFPIALTIHNIEEAIWMPGFAGSIGYMKPVAGASEFRFALVIITLLGYIAVFLSRRNIKGTLSAYILTGFAAGMFINAFIPHLAGTIVTGRYVPGTCTGLLLIVPASFALISSAFRQKEILKIKFIVSAVITSLILAASIPALFFIGRIILN